jgi:hypothetical protein
LHQTTTPGAQIQRDNDTWRLSIPTGPAGTYRLAQFDDYAGLRRSEFPWQPPVQISFAARASSGSIPGTWGVGLWNDPFSFSLGFGGASRRFPALPNAAWFFFASPENYLSLRDDLPAHGPLAATFRSPGLPAPLLAIAGLTLPLFIWPFTARWLRRAARQFIQQDARRLAGIKPANWNRCKLVWENDTACFWVNDKLILETGLTPHGPLGFVLWIDNQYAALPPGGGVRYGTLETPETAWIEVKDLEIGPID